MSKLETATKQLSYFLLFYLTSPGPGLAAIGYVEEGFGGSRYYEHGGLFHILHDESARKKLQAESKAAWPEMGTPFSFQMAEHLPYLKLRGHPALPRIATSPTVVNEFVVPAGTVVGASH
ncbi:hypothetical protein BDZ89DRAFT_1136099 [Hymenopellis radicata]|nr:hypothetical protein BDZ89DRAFT_1136099 [Hymenopellis radicata]